MTTSLSTIWENTDGCAENHIIGRCTDHGRIPLKDKKYVT